MATQFGRGTTEGRRIGQREAIVHRCRTTALSSPPAQAMSSAFRNEDDEDDE